MSSRSRLSTPTRTRSICDTKWEVGAKGRYIEYRKKLSESGRVRQGAERYDELDGSGLVFEKEDVSLVHAMKDDL